MRRSGIAATVFLIAGGYGSVVATDVQAQELPQGVTEEMVKDGKQLFTGVGICFACHGQNAKGLPGVGPDLTDNKWLHSNGSVQEIADLVLVGVPAERSKSGVIMPPKGGSTLNEQQIKAVAAYVWTLSGRAARAGASSTP